MSKRICPSSVHYQARHMEEFDTSFVRQHVTIISYMCLRLIYREMHTLSISTGSFKSFKFTVWQYTIAPHVCIPLFAEFCSYY